jgi:hypothetical protein
MKRSIRTSHRRRGWAFPLILTGIMLAGCSSTMPVEERDPYAALDRIKKETADGEARVTLVDGTSMMATMVHGNQDTVHWKDPVDWTEVSVPTWQIKTIALNSHGKGAGQGLGIGALSGAALGGLAGLADGDDPEGFLSFSKEAKAGLGAGAGVIVGGVIGLLAGAASGSSTTFDFQVNDSAEDVPNLPEVTVNAAIEERWDPADDDERQREQWR